MRIMREDINKNWEKEDFMISTTTEVKDTLKQIHLNIKLCTIAINFLMAATSVLYAWNSTPF